MCRSHSGGKSRRVQPDPRGPRPGVKAGLPDLVPLTLTFLCRDGARPVVAQMCPLPAVPDTLAGWGRGQLSEVAVELPWKEASWRRAGPTARADGAGEGKELAQRLVGQHMPP